jgi:adenylate kinase
MTENKIIFIGGIHGVGKGTLCKKLSTENMIAHFSSSDLLKWNEISAKENKVVKDFNHTQNRLIEGIENQIEKNKLTLLDGHFCLLNQNGMPEKIDEEVFRLIQPIAICIKTQDVDTIHERLEIRDGNKYKIETLNAMQELELSQALKVSHLLSIPLFQVDQNSSIELENFINKNK